MHNFVDISMNLKLSYIEEMKKYELILNSLGYIMCLTGGTMLGAIREGKFIDHDNDIDVAVIMRGANIVEVGKEKDYIVNHLVKLGYEIIKNTRSQFKPYLQIPGICLDTFTYYFDENDKAFFYPYNGCFDKQDIVPLIPVKLYNTNFLALGNYEKIFTVLYDNWRVPQTKKTMLERKLHEGPVSDLNQIKWADYNK